MWPFKRAGRETKVKDPEAFPYKQLVVLGTSDIPRFHYNEPFERH